MNDILDHLVLECLACREPLLLASRVGFHEIIVEGDSLVVIQSITGHNISITIKGLIKDIWHLSNLFNSISFSHVKRDENKAAML